MIGWVRQSSDMLLLPRALLADDTRLPQSQPVSFGSGAQLMQGFEAWKRGTAFRLVEPTEFASPAVL